METPPEDRKGIIRLYMRESKAKMADAAVNIAIFMGKYKAQEQV